MRVPMRGGEVGGGAMDENVLFDNMDFDLLLILNLIISTFLILETWYLLFLELFLKVFILIEVNRKKQVLRACVRRYDRVHLHDRVVLTRNL